MIFYSKYNAIEGEISLPLSLSIKKTIEYYSSKSKPNKYDTILGYIEKDNNNIDINDLFTEYSAKEHIYKSDNSNIKLYGKNYYFTHKVISKNHKEIPLWFSHELLSTVENVKIYKHSKNNKIEIVDFLLENGIIYHNLQFHTNEYDSVYYTISYVNEGVSYSELLSADSTGKELLFSDLDADGNIKPNILRYTRTSEGLKYVYSFQNNYETIYYKKAHLNNRMIMSKDEKCSRSLKIKDFHLNLNNKIYWLENPFNNEYQFNPNLNYKIINKNLIHIQEDIVVDEAYPLVIRFYTESGILKSLYSNILISENNITGKLISKSDITNGLIYLENSFNENYVINISGFNKANYNYLDYDFNTKTNPAFKDTNIYVYLEPNRNFLFYIEERYGVIVDCSDHKKKISIEGSFNSNTIVGNRINAWLETTTFYNRTNNILLIAIVSSKDNDVNYVKSIKHNTVDYHPFNYLLPNINSEGLFFNQNEIMFLDISYSLLEEYSMSEILKLVNKYKSSGKKLIVRWIEDPSLEIEINEGSQNLIIQGVKNINYIASKSYDNISWETIEEWTFDETKIITLNEAEDTLVYLKCEPIINESPRANNMVFGVKAI